VQQAKDNVELAREAVQQAKDNVELTRESVQQAKEDVELTREAVRQTTAALDLDRERWKVELDERQRWQARLISLQLEQGTPSAHHGLLWTVNNDSPTGVQNVRAFYVAQGVVKRVEGTGRERNIARRDQWQARAELILDPGVMNIGITFQDNGGRWWGRWANGDLQPWRADHDEDLIEHALDP
jgi:hypothetical protein